MQQTSEMSPVVVWLIRLPVLLVTGLMLFSGALVALVVAFHLNYDNRITPGVTAFGLDIGGMTPAAAVNMLASQFAYDDNAVFTFHDGDDFWQLSAGELGLSFDAEATVMQATLVDNDISGGLVDRARVWFNGQAITPIIRYNQSLALSRLAEIARTTDRPPADATLRVEGDEVLTTPGQVGRTLNIPATLGRLDAAITTLVPGGEIPLVYDETSPRIWNADEAASQLRAALSGSLELVVSGEALGPWTISADQIRALLRTDLVENPDGSLRHTVSVDMRVFAAFLDELTPGLLVPPRDGRFHFNDQTRQLEIIRPAVSGRQLNVAETLARLEEAVFRYDRRTVPMAFNYTEPRYHNGITAEALGITTMVAEATTIYTGSTGNRRHNIAHGASLYDGIIIGPGEEFSFNYFLGDVSEEAGFLEGKVIVGGRTVAGVGGGICQVSTTVFRAAFFGGYTIIERNSHAYRVGYYELNNAPPGLDAAIWSPERDFRFQNDTPYHLLIETSVYPANNSLQFRFYSTNPGRVVEVSQPEVRNVMPSEPPAFEANRDLQPGQIIQVDYAAEGADVEVERIIRDMDGNEIQRDSIYTHYLPWQAVYEVAPGDSRLNS